jgi:hypothetical protein
MPATGTISEWDLRHRIEDVRTFAGQTVTFSIWMKSSTAHNARLYLTQNFGSGGSTSVGTDFTFTGITSTWTRYSVTVAVPSIAGKTIGTSSFLEFDVYATTSIGNSTTIDFWGVQVEAGSTATAFQTASGTIGGELALCQRYYNRATAGDNPYAPYAIGWGGASSTNGLITFTLPVRMRVNPTSLDFSGLAFQDVNGLRAVSSVTINQSSAGSPQLAIVTTGMTANLVGTLLSNNTTSSFLGFSAEL